MGQIQYGWSAFQDSTAAVTAGDITQAQHDAFVAGVTGANALPGGYSLGAAARYILRAADFQIHLLYQQNTDELWILSTNANVIGHFDVNENIAGEIFE